MCTWTTYKTEEDLTADNNFRRDIDEYGNYTMYTQIVHLQIQYEFIRKCYGRDKKKIEN